MLWKELKFEQGKEWWDCWGKKGYNLNKVVRPC